MLEARLVPLELVDYRPVPVSGGVARRTLLQLWERSMLGAEADRDAQNAVRIFSIPRRPRRDRPSSCSSTTRREWCKHRPRRDG